MITSGQIKAARALLGWRQEDLAQRSGLSLAAINKLERDLVSPRRFTLDILQQTFERSGIEFTEGPGVRLTDNIFEVQNFSGKDAPIRLINDVLNTLLNGGGGLMLCGIEEAKMADYADHIAHQAAQFKAKGIPPTRILIRQGDTNFFKGFDPAKQYRWITKELFTQMPYYVYADKVAMILWGKPIRVVIIKNHIVADTFRRQFEINWKHGTVPLVSKRQRI